MFYQGVQDEWNDIIASTVDDDPDDVPYFELNFGNSLLDEPSPKKKGKSIWSTEYL